MVTFGFLEWGEVVGWGMVDLIPCASLEPDGDLKNTSEMNLYSANPVI